MKDGDWGNITTREAGLLVWAAIAKAEELMTRMMKDSRIYPTVFIKYTVYKNNKSLNVRVFRAFVTLAKSRMRESWIASNN